jgi:thiol-disulfide isomerase/thioredoxin
MSGDTKQNTVKVLMVIGLSAAIGFGAVYAMVGGGDNSSQPDGAEKTSLQVSKTSQATPGAGIKNAAKAELPKDTDGSAGSAGHSQGADGKPLNRGEMTTFVFKKQATAPTKPPTFNGPDGKAMTISAFKGRVVLLNLWATWCAPCRKEMPDLNALQQELGSDQFEVVALSVDRGSPEKAQKFLAEVGANALKFYHDPTAQAGFSLMAIGMPSTLLFDREGREIGRLVGPAKWDSQDAKNLIQAVIAGG